MKSEDKGIINDFKKAATYLAKFDPVVKGKTNQDSKVNYSISSQEVSSTLASNKPSKGKSGVEFHYYENKEFKKLTNVQKKELSEWKECKQGESESSSSSNPSMDKKKVKFGDKISR